MIASWKRQAIDGMAGTFSGAGDAAKAASEGEVEAARQDRAVGRGAGFLAKAFGR
jgi:transposase